MDQQTLFSAEHHPYYNSQMQKQTYDLGDLIEMESMQFVNPHEINPLIQDAVIQSADVPLPSADAPSQVSLKSDKPEFGDIIQNNIKMEEFSDLSTLFMGTKIGLTGYVDELATPIFDNDAFDFTSYPSVKLNEDKSDPKVKVEYNAQYYSCDKNMYKDFNLGTDAKVQDKENCSISRVGNEQPEVNLYQPYAPNISYKNKMDDIRSNSYQDLNSFDNTAAFDGTSFSNNLSVNSNIKYSNSTVPSPQDDRYSYISSPGNNDQQVDTSLPIDGDHAFETKVKLNLMIDHFKLPIKNENSQLNTPDVIDEVVNMGTEFNILDLVNNEDITVISADEELLLSLTSPSSVSLPPSTPSTVSSQPTSPVKKFRRRKLSHIDDDDEDDNDEDYVPPVKRRSTVRLTDIDIEDSNSSDDSDYHSKKSVKKTKTNKARGRPPKSADSVSSNYSNDGNLSKYRELRDKNNEASRKSRLKRRIKELEYEKEAEELQSQNIRLKAQVEELEKMVSTFRNNLFKILVNK